MREHEYFVSAMPFSKKLLVGSAIILGCMWVAHQMVREASELTGWKIFVFGAMSVAAFVSTAVVDKLSRLPVFRGIFNVPYVGGIWFGSVTHDHTRGRCAVMQIHQNYSHILIEMKTDRTVSHSTSALIFTKPDNSCRTEYMYFCEPMNPDGESHRGTCILDITKCGADVELIRGKYYADLLQGPRGSVQFTTTCPKTHCEDMECAHLAEDPAWCLPFRKRAQKEKVSLVSKLLRRP